MSYKEFAGIEPIVEKVALLSIEDARAKGLSFSSVQDFAEKVENDMYENLPDLISKEECEKIMKDNAYTLLQFGSAVRNVVSDYCLDATRPVEYITDIMAIIAYNYIEEFCKMHIIEEFFNSEPTIKIGFAEEYLLKEKLKFKAEECADAYRINGMIEGIICRGYDI